MAMEGTWQHLSNEAYIPASVLDNSRHLLWSIKAFLKGELGGAVGAGVLWTCYYSCDGAEAGVAADGVDRWGAVYNGTKILRTAGANHSWMVLRSPVMPSGERYYLIIDFKHATQDYWANFIYSKAAPTGGTTTDRPTATDEWTNGRAAGMQQLNDNTFLTHRYHASINEYGGFYFASGKNAAGWMNFGMIVDELANPPDAGDAYRLFCYTSYLNTTPGPFSSFHIGSPGPGASYGTGSMHLNSAVAADVAQAWSIIPGYGINLNTITSLVSATVGRDVVSGKYFDFPCYIMNNLTAGISSGVYPYRGRLRDFALGGEAPQGSVDPVAGPTTSCLLGNLWVPANTAPLL